MPARRDVALGLAWGQATFRMLRTVSMLQSDRVWNSLTRRRARVAPGSDGRGRRRLAIDDGLLFVGFFVFFGVVVLNIMLFLLALATAEFPSCILFFCRVF